MHSFKYILFFACIILVSCSDSAKRSERVNTYLKEVQSSEKEPSYIPRVLLQPYASFSKEYTEAVKLSIENNYGFKVHIATSIDLPKKAFVQLKSPRYRADSLLRFQSNSAPDSIDFVVGLTAKDISTTKYGEDGKVMQPASRYQDWGVFGLGYMLGNSSIVSTFRLKGKGDTILLERLKKVVNHELGHNLGLPHCTSDDNCVLRDAAESIKTVDQVALTLCDKCRYGKQKKRPN